MKPNRKRIDWTEVKGDCIAAMLVVSLVAIVTLFSFVFHAAINR